LYNGKKTGSLGLAAAFSFFIAHNIQAGEFGCVTTNDDELAHLMQSMKGNGRRCYCLRSEIENGKCPHVNDGFHPRYISDYIGFNFKPMEYTAGVCTVQLKKADWIMQKRLENVRYLNDNLESVSDILRLPPYSDDVSYLGYPLLVTSPSHTRNKIVLELEKLGIECRPIFNCIPTQQPAYGYLAKQYAGKLPNAEYVGNNGFYIGCHQYLETADLDYAVSAIKKVLK
ncbi:MAG: DegT/DnrJ/EryC1/StrS family aminotransferase, partial [Candidatus Diapherotrites archaeon]|nr:DegT/DnrJ/EryC1/StrS family aminotransferase [Candidatus Diapherotrites archaeon]